MQAFFANVLPQDNRVIATDQERAEYATKLKQWEEKTASIRREIATFEEPYRRKATVGAITKFPEDIQAVDSQSRRPSERRWSNNWRI